MPHTLRNPLYHWTHLELARYLGIFDLLDETTAPAIWRRANAALAEGGLSARSILRKFHVLALCTTDDPCDDLTHHKAVAESESAFRMYPTFRPDKALDVNNPEAFRAWVERLSMASNVHIVTLADFLDARLKSSNTTSRRFECGYKRNSSYPVT